MKTLVKYEMNAQMWFEERSDFDQFKFKDWSSTVQFNDHTFIVSGGGSYPLYDSDVWKVDFLNQ